MAHPTSEERIAAEEERLGRRLPDALRARLLEENGGEVETDDRYTDSVEDSVWELGGVADLHRDKKGRAWMGEGFADVTAAERESWAEMFDGVPEGTVVIAGNGTADLLLLLPDDRFAWWDHETAEWHEVGVRLRVGEGEFRDRAA